MKKLILIAIALVTINATAQEHKKELDKRERGERAEMLKDLTPEEMATLQTKKMTLHLDLTEAQQTKIQALNLEQIKLRKAKMEERKKMSEDKTAQKPSKEERVKMMNEKLDHQIEMKKKMKEILNAEQFEKWEKSQAKQHQRRGPKIKEKKQ